MISISPNNRYITNWVFLNGAWILNFIGPAKSTINYLNC